MAAVSPLQDADGVIRLTIASGGQPLPDLEVIRVTVRRAIDEVPGATLVIRDGDLPGQGLPASDSPRFVPGAAVEIRAGYDDREATIFKGLVVRHGIAIDAGAGARLVVECRDAAVRMTEERHNVQWTDATDAEVISTLLSGHGLAARVTSTTLRHEALVQHDCTDWDFMRARAAASGLLVIATDGAVTVAPPQPGGAAALAVTCGEDLIEFEAGLETGPPDAQVPPPRSGALRLRGHMRFQGSALAAVGSHVDLKGVGTRFDGAVFVTAVRHDIANGEWTTEVQFGTAVPRSGARTGVVAPPEAGRMPGIEGLQAGVVCRLDGDPAGQHRVQVQIPAAGAQAVWARLLQFHASSGFGAFFVPEVGDDVLLGFLAGDPASPVVLGSLYSSGRPPPAQLDAGNPLKTIVTRCRAKIEVDDENEVVTVTTPGGNAVVLSDTDRSVVVSDCNGNAVRLGSGGIALDSVGDIRLEARGAITASATGALRLQSEADVQVEGLNVTCNARVGLTAKGSATAELSASGQTTVKGAMVMIN